MILDSGKALANELHDLVLCLGLGLVFVLHFVHVMHFISCHHVHLICIRVRLMHPSIFPVVRFAIRRSYALRRSPFVSRCERVLNVFGLNRHLSCGLGLLPVDKGNHIRD